MNKKRIVVVCPGRGSYSRDTSNYLKDIDSSLVSMIEDQDQLRVSKKLKGILELDKSSFRSKVHMAGENASPLIYSCSLKDYDAIKGIDFKRHSPKFILIECWNDFDIDRILQGKIHRKLTENNYELTSWTINTLIYRIK